MAATTVDRPLEFLQLDLHNVEPLACLKGLNASVSKSPSELLTSVFVPVSGSGQQVAKVLST